MSTGGTPRVGLGGGLGSLELELEDSGSWLPMVGTPGAGGDATASTLASRPASAVTAACGSVTTGVSLAEEENDEGELVYNEGFMLIMGQSEQQFCVKIINAEDNTMICQKLFSLTVESEQVLKEINSAKVMKSNFQILSSSLALALTLALP